MTSADRLRSENNKSFRLRVFFFCPGPPGQPGVDHGPVWRLLEESGKPINQLVRVGINTGGRGQDRFVSASTTWGIERRKRGEMTALPGCLVDRRWERRGSVVDRTKDK